MKQLKFESSLLKAFVISFFISLVLSNITASAGEEKGQVLEGIKFFIKILNKEVRYTIYLSCDYQNSTRRYPVVYLLHGYPDNDTAWVQFGEVNLTADKAIANQQIPPMIIVMTDGGATWYINDYQNKVRYEDIFFQEIFPILKIFTEQEPSKNLEL